MALPLFAAVPAERAGAITGAELWQKCLSEFEAACNGYIVGVADSLAGSRFCPPLGWTSQYDRLKDLAIVYMRDHQDLHYLPAAVLVAEALGEIFPCTPPSPLDSGAAKK